MRKSDSDINWDEENALQAVDILSSRCVELEQRVKDLEDLLRLVPVPIYNQYIADEAVEHGIFI